MVGNLEGIAFVVDDEGGSDSLRSYVEHIGFDAVDGSDSLTFLSCFLWLI